VYIRALIGFNNIYRCLYALTISVCLPCYIRTFSRLSNLTYKSLRSFRHSKNGVFAKTMWKVMFPIGVCTVVVPRDIVVLILN
jgi:hypothetical protein